MSVAEIIRSYKDTDAYKAVETQLNTVAREEQLFDEVLKERDMTEKYSQIQRVKASYDKMFWFLGTLELSHPSSKFIVEYVQKALDTFRKGVIFDRTINDEKVYTDWDWKKLEILIDKMALDLVEACANSSEQQPEQNQHIDPYKKAE